MIPGPMLPHTVTVVEPDETTDTYNNTVDDYGAGATRTVLSPSNANGGVWLQQDQRSEPHPDGRDPLDQKWLLIANYSAITGKARIEWADHPQGAVVFRVEGPPEPAYTPAGFHHIECTLRVTEG